MLILTTIVFRGGGKQCYLGIGIHQLLLATLQQLQLFLQFIPLAVQILFHAAHPILQTFDGFLGIQDSI